MVSVHTCAHNTSAHTCTQKNKERKEGKKKGRKDGRKNEGRKEGKEEITEKKSPVVSIFFSLKEKCTLTFRRQLEPGISGTWDLKPFSVSHFLSETRAVRSLIDFGLFLSSKLKEPRV